MQLDPDVCYRALRTRDARFDGRFFTAVRSTGVYCRPICPAPTPKRANCSFVPSAAAAQDRGFRPCLRCRPEASPGTPAWLGTSTTVSRALRLIAQGALDGDSVDGLAARLGLGARHLRRLFLQHVGATPISVAQTRRVLFAKKLIDETRLPFAEIALASGYSSIRRFNDAIRRTYERTPRELRRGRAADVEVAGSELTLRLSFRPPFQWEALLGFLRARATAGVEAVAEDAYARTVEVDGGHGWVEVRRVPGADRLSARIHVSSSAALIRVSERVRALFDLDADPDAIGRQLSSDPLLGPTVRALPGVRIPGAWDAFELAVRAILGQQVSVRGATTLAGRLVAAHGEKLASCSAGRPHGLHSLFPTPEVLARAELADIGLPRARAHSIRALAAAIAAGELVLDPAAGLDATVGKLRSLPGIGDWTAHYVAMRALREPDAFPASDLGLRRAAAANGERPTAAELSVQADAWRPWRAYAAMYLWLSSTTEETKKMRLELSEIPSPIGTVVLVTRPETGQVCALDFDDCRERMHELLARRFGPCDLVPSARTSGPAGQVRAYLEGDLGALDEIRVDTCGTPFQQRVWLRLREIAPGTTRSYAELARTIGRPGAARAVGSANGRNPIALILPCHRVIAADGSLGGYAGGLERKRWLLRHEGVVLRSATAA